MRITVVGAGYVGLVAAVCLASSGHEVICVEKDKSKLSSLEEGVVPFYEPGAKDLLKRGLSSGRLKFASSVNQESLSELVFIAVGTPSTVNGRADLSQVYSAVSDVIRAASSPLILVMKSTVPPGLGGKIIESYLKNASVKVDYVSNPEFLKEGQAVEDWCHPDRIVLGGESKETIDKVREVYADIDAPILVTDTTSAELIKYASNAFLTMKVSFINEVANLCDCIGANVDDVAQGVGMDPRIGEKFLRAGIGYGGSCFPKDTRALDFASTFNGYAFNLLKAVIEVNNRQRILVIQRLREVLGNLSGKQIAVLGLSFKPDTDDVRESPSLDIISLLLEEEATVVAYDPLAMKNAQAGLPSEVRYAQDAISATAGSHAVVLATEWPEFTGLNWKKVKQSMKPPFLVIDGRNVLPMDMLKEMGYHYVGIGRR